MLPFLRCVTVFAVFSFSFFLSDFILAQVNQDPVFTSNPVITVNDNAPYRYVVSVEDVDNDLIELNSINLPAWLSLDQNSEGVVTTFAGSFPGFLDGTGGNAFFSNPDGIDIDDSGNLYVADVANHRIRKITSEGIVSTLAGSVQGYADGTGTNARFNTPIDLTLDQNGNVYVADAVNHRIRKITPAGVVTTIAGSEDRGYIDGIGTNALFTLPLDIVVDHAGNLFVSDVDSNTIRKITPSLKVSTFVGGGESDSWDGLGTTARIGRAEGMVVDAYDNIYFGDTGNNTIRKVTKEGLVSTIAGSGDHNFKDGLASESAFRSGRGLALDHLGNVFVADQDNGKIRRISPDGKVTTVAGGGAKFSNADGTSAEAAFLGPADMVFDQSNNLYVADKWANRIRKISFPYALLEGDPSGLHGVFPINLNASDGNSAPVVQSFDLEVNDVSAPLVLRIERSSTITASSPSSELKFLVSFSERVSGVDIDDFEIKQGGAIASVSLLKELTDGQVFEITVDVTQAIGILDLDLKEVNDIQDQQSQTLGSLIPAKVEETYDFQNQAPSFTSSPPVTINAGQEFRYQPRTFDPEGSRVVLSAIDLPDWISLLEAEVSTIAGGKPRYSGYADGYGEEVRFRGPSGSALDIEGNLYIADSDNHRIRKIDISGRVTTLAGSIQGDVDGVGDEAQFGQISFIEMGEDGFLYVVDVSHNKIKKVSLEGEVTTYAGSVAGADDGDISVATFSLPINLRYQSGTVYITDNKGIRIIKNGNTVSTLELTNEETNAPFTFNTISGFDVDENGTLYVADRDSYKVYKVTPEGKVSVWAGSTEGDLDGSSTQAMFGTISSLELDEQGNIYLTDIQFSKVRRISVSGYAETVAGSINGALDGEVLKARFRNPADVTYSPDGSLIICDRGNQQIRKVELSKTLVGTPPLGIRRATVNGIIRATDDMAAANDQEFSFDIVPAILPEFASALSVSFEENGSDVVYHATVNNENDIIYRLSEELDASGFNLTSDGWLYFKSPPDFEIPTDSDGNNTYEVEFIASNGAFSTSQKVSVLVTNLSDEAPSIVSTPIVSVNSDDIYNYLIETNDPDGDEVTFSIEDLPDWMSLQNNLLQGDPTGQIGVHSIKLKATDTGGNFSIQEFDVIVNDAAFPLFTSADEVVVDENVSGSIYKALAIHTQTVTYSLGNLLDESHFAIDPSSGDLSFLVSPDFENPDDENANNQYDLVVTADNGSNTSDLHLKVMVANINEQKPAFNSVPVTAVDDNAVYTYAVDVSDSDGGAIQLEAEFLPEWLSIDPGSYVIEGFVGAGTSGSQDGSGTDASFYATYGLEVDPEGNIFVADGFNNQIRKVTPAGLVTTFATGLNDPSGLAMDAQGNLYVAEYSGVKIVKITPAGSTSILAGSSYGSLDGTGTEARFSVLSDIVFGPDDNLYVTDYSNHTIRRVSLDGVVTTLAGSGSAGLIDGPGTSALFNGPSNLTFDADGNLYVTDSGNSVIRKINLEGEVSTLAGSGSSGFSDGAGTLAEFNLPFGIALDQDNNLIVADFNNRRLRRVTTSGEVTTILGSGAAEERNGTGTEAAFNGMFDLAFDKSGNLYVSTGSNGNSIRRVSLTAPLIQGDATGIAGEHNVSLKATDTGGFYATQDFTIVVNDVTLPVFVSPAAVSFQEQSTQRVYNTIVTDANEERLSYSLGTAMDESLFEISSFSGLVSFKVAADYENPADGNTDNIYAIEVQAHDGANMASQIVEITVTDINEGALSFTSTSVTSIERGDQYQYIIETHNPNETEVEVRAMELPSWIDLTTVADVTSINGGGFDLVQDESGNIYFLQDNQIKKRDASGDITVLAGSGSFDFADGSGLAASFAGPRGITLGPDGVLYVADTRNHRIRKVTLDGVVTTYTGSDASEVRNGSLTEAKFIGPLDLAFDSEGNLFVTDFDVHMIRKISTDGEVSTFAGNPISQSFIPTYSRSFADGTGTEARFAHPTQLTIDKSDNIYLTDQYNYRIRKITPEAVVTTVAGNDTEGLEDGNGTNATLGAVLGIAIDDLGRIVFSQPYIYGVIRMIDTNGDVITLTSLDIGFKDGIGSEVQLSNTPLSLTLGTDGFIYTGSDFIEITRKISLKKALAGDPFHHVGSHEIALKAETNSEVANQSFTLVVEDNIPPSIEQIVRANPVDEVVSTDWTQFLVQFTEPVLNVTAESFELKKGDILAEVSQVIALNDSLYNITVSGIDGFGVLDLDLAESQSVTDANGQSLTGAMPLTEETYSIEANKPPVFLSGPEIEVTESQNYDYVLKVYDADADSVSFADSNLPSWLGLKYDTYEVKTFVGSTSRGSKDGLGTDATFQNAYGMTTDRLGNIYVVDSNGSTIRKISSNGVVTTLTRRLFKFIVSSSGTSVNFYEPNDLVVDGMGNIYFSSERFGTIEKLDPFGHLTRVAGGVKGYSDGTGAEASFDGPTGMALDPSGNIIVADRENARIRKVTPEGVVTTIVTSGDDEGLYSPRDVAVDKDGNIYVADAERRKIKKIDTNNVLTTYAGSSAGEGDGSRLEAGFRAPIAIEVDDEGNVYVADVLNYAIRKIGVNGMVTTIAGSPTGGMSGVGIEAPLSDLGGLALAPNGKLYATTNTTKVIEVSKVISLTGNPSGQAGSHSVSLGLNDGRGGTTRQDFTIEVSDDTPPVLQSIIRLNPVEENINCNTVTFQVSFKESLRNVDVTDFEIKSGGASGSVVDVRLTANPAVFDVEVSGIAGTGSLGLQLANLTDILDVAGNSLDVNAIPTVEEAYILSNSAPVFGSDPTILLSTNNHYTYPVIVTDVDADQINISAITLPEWLSLTRITKVTTLAGNGTSGNDNGVGTDASFGALDGIAIDSKGNVYLADTPNNQIRRLSVEGEVSTFAGSSTEGAEDGNSTNARFSAPAGLAIDSDDNIYVSDRGNFAIRKITPEGEVTTLAGGNEGFVDANGSSAKFAGPSAITVANDGIVYLSDFSETGGHRIRKIKANGDVSTLAGGTRGFADGTGLYAQFSSPTGLAQDRNGNLVVVDSDNHRIRKISPTGWVSTLAGNGLEGFTNAQGTDARFSQPTGVAIDVSGNILVADHGNERIRVIDKDMNVSTLAGTESGFADGTTTLAKFSGPFDLTVDGNNNVFVTDTKNYRVRKIRTEVMLSGESGTSSGEYEVALNANDGNGGSTNQEFTITVDGTGPEVIVSSFESGYTNSSSFEVTFITSEEVQGFTSEDITLVNGTLSEFAGGGSVYNATIAPIADGEITINIAAATMTDLVGNENEAAAQFSLVSDRTAPVITIDITEPAITNAASFPVIFYLSEEVMGFTADDVSLDNATLSGFTGSGLQYSATLTPIADGDIAIGIADELMTDLAGNQNEPADPFVITSDRTSPVVTISSDVSGTINNASFDITFALSETVEGFTADDIVVGNGNLSDFAGSGTSYMATISPIADGAVTVNIAADLMNDIAGNGNKAAAQFSIASDKTAPVVTIDTTEPMQTNAATFETTFTLNEEVTAFSTASFTVQNGTVLSLDGSGTSFSADISPDADGTVTITALAGLTDAAGNVSEEQSFSLVSDQTRPLGTLTGPVTTLTNEAFIVTVEYDEEVSGFDINDLITTNAASSDLTAVVDDRKWTVLITPVTGGVVTVNLPEAVVTDNAGNTSEEGNTLTITYDGTAPEATAIIRQGSSPLLETSAVFEVTFSEGVTGVDMNDFELTTSGTVTAAVVNISATDASNYEVTINQVAGEGTVGLNLKADNSIMDAAGNILSADFSGESYTTNFSPTAIELSSSSLAENSGEGALIGTLSATDPDVEDIHIFALVAGEGSEDNGSFVVTDSELKSLQSFDFETKSSYSIRVKADDGKGGEFEQAFTVDITNVSEPALSLTGSLEFGEVGKNLSADLNFTISNTGDGPLEVTSLGFPEGFSGDWPGGTIPLEGTQTVTVTFNPTEVKMYSGEVSVISDAVTNTISTSGEGTLVTSIDDPTVFSEEITLYPNPANKLLIVDLSAFGGRAVTLSIQDASGRLRLSKTGLRDAKVTFDVSSYEEGMFIIQMSDGKSRAFKKFMIRR